MEPNFCSVCLCNVCGTIWNILYVDKVLPWKQWQNAFSYAISFILSVFPHHSSRLSELVNFCPPHRIIFHFIIKSVFERNTYRVPSLLSTSITCRWFLNDNREDNSTPENTNPKRTFEDTISILSLSFTFVMFNVT